MTEVETRVFEALNDPKWDWRSLEGLKQATGLSGTQILEVINSHSDKIETAQSTAYGLVFRPKSRAEEPLIEKALDYLTLGKRSRVA